jgi:uncharacterized protein (TIGR01777 family)
MKVMISGSGGLIGSALVTHLNQQGDHVVRLVRRGPAVPGKEVVWGPEVGSIDARGVEGLDALVHLAGENIAARRWTAAQKARIRDSRVVGTRLLAETLARLESPPKVWICASAIGFYGDRGDDELDESSGPGTGFLADVCQAWESATVPAQQPGVRVVCLRIGVVLSAAGGALAKMLLPFKLGLGGRIGSGQQYMSWIAVDDAVRAIVHGILTDACAGPINAVAPEPASNAEFTKTLGRVLRRPTIFPMPAFAARLAFGEMADELLLASTRVRPARLSQTGFSFQFPNLEAALRHVLGRD